MSRHEEHERVRQRLGGLAVSERPWPSGVPRRGPGVAAATAGARTGDRDHWDDEELAPSSGPPGEVRTPGWLDDGRTDRRNRFVPERFRQARLDTGLKGSLALGLVGLVAVLVTGVMVMRDQPMAQSVPPVPSVRADSTTVRAEPAVEVAAVASMAPSASAEVVVSVVGLVERVGLHRLPGGSRVADAIEMAGGIREGADLAGLNLAQRLSDGDQVVVGATGPNSGPPVLGSVMISATDRAPGTGPNVAGSTGTPSSTGTSRVDLNTANEAELDALPGVGPVTAKAILAWRATNGRFTDVAQLGDVDGIGPARLARLRDLVRT
ncbi:competence protein ComEA [Nocardia mangyaensis]|uniref:Competence protein ComEA n=1 Tax=Nocardia mangyaensis TaxID=2213200 RepID=A0A1J0VNZ2_9NOCA|nr:ComEA family DNA-binding protein [Nocardia mangyaensis]APE33733.1 competence protein ComEA [Nocardia mangyaensis]